jgi:hypothetical protein
MDEVIKEYLEFLSEEYGYLFKIKLFLMDIPDMIATGSISELEFQGFLEKHEVETSRFLFEKNRYQESIAKNLHISKEQVTLKLLVHLGYKAFEEQGRNVLRITNEITLHLVKISVFLKNFSKMQQEFKRLNNFLYQENYSPQSIDGHTAYSFNRGRNFYGEA